MSDTIHYNSVSEIVQHYGKPRQFAERFEVTLGNANSFLQRKSFPPKYFVKHSAILQCDNIEAPPTLWGQVQPRQAAE